MFKNWALPV